MKKEKFSIEITPTKAKCPVGEKTAKHNINNQKIPVLSCEGGCIRGEIARQAANILAKKEGFSRGCHGEFMSIPDSGITNWINSSEKVVLIDGCFLRCHGRIFENMFDDDKLIQFDALSHYKKYTDVFDIDAVPEKERLETANVVADWVFESLQA